MSRTPAEFWDARGATWSDLGPPLRPSAFDVAVFGAAVRDVALPHAGRRALLLGLTPEIVGLPWPDGTSLLAVDRSLGMIRSLWSGAGGGWVAASDWRQLPVRTGGCDVVLGDGSYNALPSGREYEPLTREIVRVLRRSGRFVIRCFVRPLQAEPVDRVVDDLHAGRIGSFHAFKWRLAMALHDTFEAGVRLADVWDAWHRHVPDPERLARARRWAVAEVATIEAYRGVDQRYTFPTLAELRRATAGLLAEIDVVVAPYELGERCPILTFRPR